MDCANPRAGQHRNRSFGNHRQIDGDAVAFLDAARFKRIGEAADIAVELRISDCAVSLLRIIRLPIDRDAISALFKMPVERIGAQVQLAFFEPANVEVVLVIGRVLHRLERPDPIDALCLLLPEPVHIIDRTGVFFGIAFRIDLGRFGPFFRNRKQRITHSRISPSLAGQTIGQACR